MGVYGDNRITYVTLLIPLLIPPLSCLGIIGISRDKWIKPVTLNHLGLLVGMYRYNSVVYKYNFHLL